MSEQNNRGGVKREFDQAKKFMRYVLPGLVFFVLLGIALYINPLNYKTYTFIQTSMQWRESKGIIAAIGLILSSGALGYIFSNIYHLLGIKLDIDYVSILRQLHRNPNIMIVKECGCTYSMNDLKNVGKKDALVVANQIWMYCSGMNPGFSELEKYAARNADMLHGMGATVLGALIAFIIWGIMALHAEQIFKADVCLYYILVGWPVLLIILGFEYWKFRKFAYSYCRSSILSGISNLKKEDIMNKIYMIQYSGF